MQVEAFKKVYKDREDRKGQWEPINSRNEWRIRVVNDVLSKRRVIRSIVDAISTLGMSSWGKWEIFIKGPDRKNTVIFINWREELRLSEVFEEFSFTSIK